MQLLQATTHPTECSNSLPQFASASAGSTPEAGFVEVFRGAVDSRPSPESGGGSRFGKLFETIGLPETKGDIPGARNEEPTAHSRSMHGHAPGLIARQDRRVFNNSDPAAGGRPDALHMDTPTVLSLKDAAGVVDRPLPGASGRSANRMIAGEVVGAGSATAVSPKPALILSSEQKQGSMDGAQRGASPGDISPRTATIVTATDGFAGLSQISSGGQVTRTAQGGYRSAANTMPDRKRAGARDDAATDGAPIVVTENSIVVPRAIPAEESLSPRGGAHATVTVTNPGVDPGLADGAAGTSPTSNLPAAGWPAIGAQKSSLEALTQRAPRIDEPEEAAGGSSMRKNPAPDQAVGEQQLSPTGRRSSPAGVKPAAFTGDGQDLLRNRPLADALLRTAFSPHFDQGKAIRVHSEPAQLQSGNGAIAESVTATPAREPKPGGREVASLTSTGYPPLGQIPSADTTEERAGNLTPRSGGVGSSADRPDMACKPGVADHQVSAAEGVLPPAKTTGSGTALRIAKGDHSLREGRTADSMPGSGLQAFPVEKMETLPATESGRRLSTAAVSDPFAQLDRLTEAPAQLLHASSHQLDVGLRDSSMGWVEIKAHLAAGQVSASLAAESHAAHNRLTAALPGMAEYLADRDIGITRLAVESQTVQSGFGGGSHSSHSGAGDAGQQHAGRRPQFEVGHPAAEQQVEAVRIAEGKIDVRA